MSLIPRVIPCLLIEDEVFVKTIGFAEPTYVGDPINVINLFNRFEVDEIVVIDIGATTRGRPPQLELIGRLASECWVPLTYGGGISDLETAATVLGIGAEKVVLGTAAVAKPELVMAIAERFGRQAVVVSVDARPDGDAYGTFVRGGREPTGLDPIAHARAAEAAGAGEILLSAIDRDGTMRGYDLPLISGVSAAVGIPVVAIGGAGRRAELVDPIRAGASAVAAGGLFVWRGAQRAVLVNFPDRAELEALFGASAAILGGPPAPPRGT